MMSKEDRKLSKKTTKSRRETAVQGTNDSSIVSKCSMAAQGYFDDAYLQGFVVKVTRRAPLIHRGYYIRAKTIDHILRTFMSKNTGPKQIVSLGAGFDSAYFRLHSLNLLTDTVFYEVDFPEVVKRKCALIKANHELMTMIGDIQTSKNTQSPLIELSTNTYNLVGVDLSQTNTLEAVLKLCGIDVDTPTLLLSECVLTYMTRRCASSVVKWAAETFSNSTFVLYEQINPDDAFGLFMQQHFHTVGSPLKCINSFPTLQAQKDRFLTLGWSSVQAMDMNQFYFGLLSQEERERVEHLEPFDEYEEWHLKCAHYMVLCGYRGNCGNLLCEQNAKQDHLESLKTSENLINICQPDKKTLLRRFGHDTSTVDSRLALSIGGFGEQKGKHMRVTEMTFTDLVTMETQFVDPGVDNKSIEVSRMHATVSCLENGRVLLIGGRMSPMKLCTQIVSVEVNCGNDENMQVDLAGSGVVKNSVMNCPNQMNCDSDVQSLEKGLVSDTAGNTSTEKCSIENCDSDLKYDVMGNKCDYNVSDKISNSCSNNRTNMGKEQVDTVSGGKLTIPMDTTENGLIQGTREQATGNVTGVSCTVLEQKGDIPCPRWRHSTVTHKINGKESLILYGGRTQSIQALGDCYIFVPSTGEWKKVETSGAMPSPRHSHSGCMWDNHMIISGGLDSDLQPLDSVHLLNIDTWTWSKLNTDLTPRYSHTCHVTGDILVCVGGVSLSHSPPGVAMIHLPSGHCKEFSLPNADKGRLLMLHRHTSLLLDPARILVLGGGGNCFSFGTLLNASPMILDISQAKELMTK